MKRTIIKYKEKVESTRLLGPGERAVIWVYGCCFDCKGCLATSFRSGSFKEDDTETLKDWFLSTSSNDLTISGGEPMLQATELACLIKEIKKSKDIGVIIYTGFVYEDLLKKAKTEKGIEELLSLTDILIDGPYVKELDNNEPYKGSSNQRIIELTKRYSDEIKSYYGSAHGRFVEIKILKDKTLMIGVPGKEQVEFWKKINES